jgi:response regulator RpfG family c-di-GMP phosphodiesterase
MAVILLTGAIPGIPLLPLHDVHILINHSKLWATIVLLSPSLIIIDENSKPHNAGKLCRDIKQNKTTRHIAVIIITDGQDCGAHADAIIQRPFDEVLFQETIKQLLTKQ